MQINFYASACIYGLHGGAVCLNDSGFIFKCQKLTIDPEYKFLQIPYEKIKSVTSGKRILFIKTTIIETTDKKQYRFLIFNRNKFKKYIKKYLNS